MKITWYGHSCFKLEDNGYSVVIDPYKDGSVAGYSPLDVTADMVLCSHEHSDHSAKECVKIIESGSTPFEIVKILSYHDAKKGLQRGTNNIFIIRSGNVKAVHFGDIGCKLTATQIEKLKDADVIMIPVGGIYTITASEAIGIIHQISPKVVIPMHYRDGDRGLPILEGVDVFTSQMFSYETIKYPGNSIEINEETQKQVAVLTYQK